MTGFPCCHNCGCGFFPEDGDSRFCSTCSARQCLACGEQFVDADQPAPAERICPACDGPR